jgi:site-specific DNA-cytosine methylase
MHAFARYAARCDPPIAVMESVRPAFTKGRVLMQQLRDYMEQGTGHRYDLYHVMHNARQLGGAGERPRYFWVASRVPFGIEWPVVRQPLLRDVIDDLKDLRITWNRQPYRRPPTWWSQSARVEEGVDGHATIPMNPGLRRAFDLMDMNGGWPQGWWIQKVAEKIYAEHGRLPDSWSPYMEKLIATDFHMGYIQLTRWDESAPSRVITGGALGLVMHPTERRTITHREAARIMGFPDDWYIRPLKGVPSVNATWGKGISVQCGEWIGTWVRRSLDGYPGSIVGKEIGDRERLITPPKQERGFTGVNPTLVNKRLPVLV